jgi:hypothetical protein
VRFTVTEGERIVSEGDSAPAGWPHARERRSSMKSSKHRKPQHLADSQPQPTPEGTIPVREMQTLPAVIAGAFTRLHLRQRVRMLRRLLLPVGPMALTVLGGGAFAKYAAQARWPRMSISFDDAARVTSAQVYELVRYVQQSNPAVLYQALAFLARDATAMAALGASVAAIVIRHRSNRSATLGPADGPFPSS